MNVQAGTAPKITIVLLPPFDGAALERLAEALKRQTAGVSEFDVAIPSGLLSANTREIFSKHGLSVRAINSGSNSIPVILNSAHLESAELVLPLYASDLPHERLIEEHLNLHRQYPDNLVAVTCISEFPLNPGQPCLTYAANDPRRPVVSRIADTAENPATWLQFNFGLSSYKKDLALQYGGFDCSFETAADIDFAFRLSHNGLSVVRLQQNLIQLQKLPNLAEIIEDSGRFGRDIGLLCRKFDWDPALEPLMLKRNLRDILAAAETKLSTFHKALVLIESHSQFDPQSRQYTIPDGPVYSTDIVARLQNSLKLYAYLQGAESVLSTAALSAEAAGAVPAFLFIVDQIPASILGSARFQLFSSIRELLDGGCPLTIVCTDRQNEGSDKTARWLNSLGATIYFGPLKRVESSEVAPDSTPRTDLGTILLERRYHCAVISDKNRGAALLQEIRRFDKNCQVIFDADNQAALTLGQSRHNIGSEFWLRELTAASGCLVLSEDQPKLIDGSKVIRHGFRPRTPPAGGFESRSGVLLLTDPKDPQHEKQVLTFLEQNWPEIERADSSLVMYAAGNQPANLPAGNPDFYGSIRWCGNDFNLAIAAQCCKAAVAVFGVGSGLKNSVLALIDRGLPVIISADQARQWNFPADGPAIIESGVKSLIELCSNHREWERSAKRGGERLRSHYSAPDRSSGHRSLIEFGRSTAQYTKPLPAGKSGRDGLVSIVIPVFNKVEFTRQCIEHLRNATSRTATEIIIVDNGSSDETAAYAAQLAQSFDHISVITNRTNLGFARACNQGAQASRGQYILFLNNDTSMVEGWLEPLVRAISGDETVGAVGAMLLYPDGTVQHAGISMIRNRMCPQFWPFHVSRGLPPDHPDVNRPKSLQAVTGACLLVRSSHFHAVGGFDEGFWNGCEDVDLCLKLQSHGLRIVYEPASIVIHYEAQSGAERFRCEDQNLVRLISKWSGTVRPEIIGFPEHFPADQLL